jgi:hypothetical protein
VIIVLDDVEHGSEFDASDAEDVVVIFDHIALVFWRFLSRRFIDRGSRGGLRNHRLLWNGLGLGLRVDASSSVRRSGEHIGGRTAAQHLLQKSDAFLEFLDEPVVAHEILVDVEQIKQDAGDRDGSYDRETK